MRSRRSVQPKMGIPSVGDIFELSTSNSYPTPYQIIKVESFHTGIKITFRLYEKSNNKNIWEMVIDSQGNKEILGISGQYIISDFRKPPISATKTPVSPLKPLVKKTTPVSQPEKSEIEQLLGRMTNPPVSSLQYGEVLSQNFDFLQNVPNEILGEIAESLDATSLKKFCQTSQKIRNFCNDEDFWEKRLNRDFPDRIQYGSSKLGLRKYYYWLSDASEGNIKPHPDRKKTPIFEFKEEQIINFSPNQYQIIEFDRFGYYPDYVLRVLDLRDQSEKFLIITKKFFVGFNVILNDIDPSKLMTYDDIDPSNHMTYNEFAKNNTDVVPLLGYGFIAFKETPSNNDGPIKFKYPGIGKEQTGFVNPNGDVFSTSDRTNEKISEEQFRILKRVGYDLYRSYPEEFGYYQKQKKMK